ncbi:hypothetical protein M6I34_08875 [Burkholderiaceae bacterium FT117]|uniref:DUF4870 family protein n=1 Tax=Zeimonas sediminis TaxID=2944268 RepID=UPI002342FBB5|nr:hypothetical protein [Zeimonas sediminis]MCM5570620.1 hypothetical protein [Zeimonas sediminis]
MNRAVTVRSAEEESLRKYAMLGYAMHLFGLVSIVGFVVGLIVAWIKRDDAAGTVYYSHFAWQSRSFWWFLLWFVLLLVPTLITVGFVPFFVLAQIWFAYRMIKGWMRLNDDREVA